MRVERETGVNPGCMKGIALSLLQQKKKLFHHFLLARYKPVPLIKLPTSTAFLPFVDTLRVISNCLQVKRRMRGGVPPCLLVVHQRVVDC